MLFGEISALSAAVLWSFSSMVFTDAAKRLGTLMLNITRMALASVLIIITMLIFGGEVMPTFNQVWLLALSGFVGLVIGDTFLFKSYTVLGPRVTSLIMSSNPAMAAIIAFLVFGEVLAPLSILGMIITLAGISLVVLSKNKSESNRFHITKLGIFYGFMGAVGQATGLIFAKMALNELAISPLMATLVRISASVLMLFPIMLVLKKWQNPITMFKEDRRALLLVGIGSIIGPYLGISLSFVAITYAKIGIASSLMSTVPILMLPLSRIVYKEKLTPVSIIGAFIAVGGVAMLFMK